VTEGTVAAQIDTIRQMLWRRFFRAETSLFYDYLTAYDDEHGQDHLPTPQEVQDRIPNPCGWGTGMEDSTINAGVMLVALCDQYEVTGDDGLAEQAARVFAGMVACAEVHGVRGFVVRSICAADGRSVYPNSSRDQYTHYVHGLWRFFGSPLSNEDQRGKIQEIMTWICEFMERVVVPENDYNLPLLDGSWPSAVCKMWEADPHEAARLPMFYAAAWQVTGEAHWEEMYRRYAWPAARQSLTVADSGVSVGYAFYQMQCSLELLFEMEEEDELRAAYREAMEICAGSVARNALQAHADAGECDLTLLPADWRQCPLRSGLNEYQVPQWGDFRKAFMAVRESGEAALVMLMCPGFEFSGDHRERLTEAIERPDFERHAGYGMLKLLAAYWRGRRDGVSLD